MTTADIDAFEVKYKCSDEEEADVLKYYAQFKGDLNKMLECVMLSSDVDKSRWVKDYIEPAIERGDVDDYMGKIKRTLGSTPAKKRKTSGKTKKKVEVEVMEESDDESDTPMAEIVDEGAEEEENAKSPNKRKTDQKSAAAKKKSSAKASKPSKKAAKKSSSEDDLIAAIRGNALARSRQAGFDSLMAGLESRYGGSDRKKKGSAEDDVDDDEFAKIQAKLMKNKESRRKK